MTTIEREINKIGYVRSPNNIYGFAGSCWYAGGPGVKVPSDGLETWIIDNTIAVINTRFPGLKYKLIGLFSSLSEYLKICCETSEPGLPPYHNSWD